MIYTEANITTFNNILKHAACLHLSSYDRVAADKAWAADLAVAAKESPSRTYSNVDFTTFYRKTVDECADEAARAYNALFFSKTIADTLAMLSMNLIEAAAIKPEETQPQ